MCRVSRIEISLLLLEVCLMYIISLCFQYKVYKDKLELFTDEHVGTYLLHEHSKEINTLSKQEVKVSVIRIKSCNFLVYQFKYLNGVNLPAPLREEKASSYFA